MLVDINLLPEKDRERSTLLLVALAIIGVAIIIWLVFFLLAQSYAKQTTNLESQIVKLQKDQEEIKASLQVSEFAADKHALEATVSWAENFQYDTVPLLTGLIGLLPDRGFFDSFDFIAPNTAILIVQFNTTNEAAYYLTRLQAAEFINDITLESVTAEDVVSEEQAIDGIDIVEDKKIHRLPRYLAVYTVSFFDERLVIEQIPETSADAEEVGNTTEEGEDNE